MIRNRSGQALLETLYSFPVGVAIFSAVIWTAGSGWSVFWIDYQLQDAVICLSDSPAQTCRLRHERAIKQGAQYLKVSSLVLEKRTHQLYGKIGYSLPFLERQSFNLEKVIPWPIR